MSLRDAKRARKDIDYLFGAIQRLEVKTVSRDSHCSQKRPQVFPHFQAKNITSTNICSIFFGSENTINILHYGAGANSHRQI